MPFELRIASEKDRDAWNRFVDSERGSFYHYFEWKYYYESGVERRRYIPLCIEDEHEEIAGIFPIVENKNGYYASLNSLPEGSSNGFITRGTLTVSEKKDIAQKFFNYIDETFSQSHAHISLQEHIPPPYEAITPSKILQENGYEFLGNLSTKIPGHYILPLKKPFKENIFNTFSKNMRNRVRHARKIGAELIIDDDFRYFNALITMQVDFIKKFGVFVPKEHYQPLLTVFPKKMKLFISLVDNEPVSGSLCYYTPTTAYGALGPYLPSAEKYLNNFLPQCYAIYHACESGYQYFDLGSTLTPSLAFYKEKFRATCVPIMTYKKTFSPIKMATNRVVYSVRGMGKKFSRI